MFGCFQYRQTYLQLSKPHWKHWNTTQSVQCAMLGLVSGNWNDSKSKQLWFIVYLYCDRRRDIRWNIPWAWRKSWGQSPRNFLRTQAIFHSISRLVPRYRHSQLQFQYCPSSIVLPIKLDLYEKILPSWLSNTGELNFNIIMFSN